MADMILMSNNMPFLYLGDAQSSMDTNFINDKRIRYVVNCTRDLPVLPDMPYMRIPVDDVYSENISAYFGDAIDLIEKARKEEAAILIHCYAGISRSATIVIAYLVSKGINLEDALKYILRKRKKVCPNRGFFNQLVRYSGSPMTYESFIYMKNRMR